MIENKTVAWKEEPLSHVSEAGEGDEEYEGLKLISMGVIAQECRALLPSTATADSPTGHR